MDRGLTAGPAGVRRRGSQSTVEIDFPRAEPAAGPAVQSTWFSAEGPDRRWSLRNVAARPSAESPLRSDAAGFADPGPAAGGRGVVPAGEPPQPIAAEQPPEPQTAADSPHQEVVAVACSLGEIRAAFNI